MSLPGSSPLLPPPLLVAAVGDSGGLIRLWSTRPCTLRAGFASFLNEDNPTHVHRAAPTTQAPDDEALVEVSQNGVTAFAWIGLARRGCAIILEAVRAESKSEVTKANRSCPLNLRRELRWVLINADSGAHWRRLGDYFAPLSSPPGTPAMPGVDAA